MEVNDKTLGLFWLNTKIDNILHSKDVYFKDDQILRQGLRLVEHTSNCLKKKLSLMSKTKFL